MSRGTDDRRPLISYALIAGMLIVSVPTQLLPALYDVFGGVGELSYPWQVFTSAFEHGWPGVPLLPHLVGNLLLIWVVGLGAEIFLGAWRYLLVTALALAFYWLTRELTGIEANGASVFIWAYAPIVFIGRRHAAPELARAHPFDKTAPVLFVMWVAVPIAMAVLIYRNGLSLPLSFLAGNAFHISGTLAGILAALLWNDRLRTPDRGPSRSRADRAAVRVGFAVPALLLTLLGAAALGRVGG